ncbi:cobalamin biosynthesis protein CobQ [Leptolyngbya sp. 'hensonii']|uniref:ParA family protein n=1 Tax=Leptolyngbya sp. 'hensonii' TaxID=1922337 RepID=UPI00094F9E46|nr:ParA family protein [Leptolyngbya sp. 'hensonii']OLP18389.1 cobalamin biosynthesis protein CobQ [Leptolyngbya sp. 'hensonii']
MNQTRIAVAARKGGVGKTTIACGLASVLASRGQKVLVIDLDPQSNAAYVLGTNPTAPGTADFLAGESPEPLKAADGLYVLPGGPDLAGHTIQSLDPEDLADAVKPLNYDVLIFDCPPGVEYLERLGLVAADVALVCTDAHPLAVIGAGRVLNELKLRQQKGRRGAKRWALALSRIDLRRSMDQTLDQQLATAYPSIKRLIVHQDSALAWAGAERSPLMQYDSNCKGAKDLQAIADWIIDG